MVNIGLNASVNVFQSARVRFFSRDAVIISIAFHFVLFLDAVEMYTEPSDS